MPLKCTLEIGEGWFCYLYFTTVKKLPCNVLKPLICILQMDKLYDMWIMSQ